jgi:hypothetical protein
MVEAKGVLERKEDGFEWKEHIAIGVFSEGDILQINPERDTDMAKRYGGMLLIVTEPKSWGAQGYLMHYTDFDAVRFSDKAFLRVKFEDVVKVGRMVWMHEEISYET